MSNLPPIYSTNCRIYLFLLTWINSEYINHSERSRKRIRFRISIEYWFDVEFRSWNEFWTKNGSISNLSPKIYPLSNYDQYNLSSNFDSNVQRWLDVIFRSKIDSLSITNEFDVKPQPKLNSLASLNSKLTSTWNIV